MSKHNGEIAFTDHVSDLQERGGSGAFYARHGARAQSSDGPDAAPGGRAPSRRGPGGPERGVEKSPAMTQTSRHPVAGATAATGSSASDDATAASDAYDRLLTRAPLLRRIADLHGRPDPFCWDDGGRTGPSNFAALLLHILSQQISTAVAFILFDRIRDATGAVPDPRSVAALGPERLRALGLSCAKASYAVNLAQMHLTGALDTECLDGLDDQQAIDVLTSARGVGLWTAEIFLIHQLRRPDVLPAGDLGIRHAVRTAWSRPDVPSIAEVRRLGQAWSPDRSYAAALLWASLRPAPAAAQGDRGSP